MNATERLRKRFEKTTPGVQGSESKTDFLLDEILRVLKVTQRIGPSIDDPNMVLDLTEYSNETIAARSEFSFLDPPKSFESGWIFTIVVNTNSPDAVMIVRTREADVQFSIRSFTLAGTNQPQSSGMYLSAYSDIAGYYGFSWQPRSMLPHTDSLTILVRNPTDQAITLLNGFVQRYLITSDKQEEL